MKEKSQMKNFNLKKGRGGNTHLWDFSQLSEGII